MLMKTGIVSIFAHFSIILRKRASSIHTTALKTLKTEIKYFMSIQPLSAGE